MAERSRNLALVETGTALDCHLTREAARIAKRFKGRPIKLMFTREDDMRSGYHRAMAAHRVEVGIGADGMPATWRHVFVSQSFLIGTSFEKVLARNGIDPLIAEGTVENKYEIPDFHVFVHQPAANVPVFVWRSVGYTHNLLSWRRLSMSWRRAPRRTPSSIASSCSARTPQSFAVC
jgi:CO/xanthine dehydrogenase Mo-binding subunit